MLCDLHGRNSRGQARAGCGTAQQHRALGPAPPRLRERQVGQRRSATDDGAFSDRLILRTKSPVLCDAWTARVAEE